jgi:transcriptional regulator with XRE-family HTH domain
MACGNRRQQLAPAKTGKGLSRHELADRAGINRNYVSILEREQHAATVDAEKSAEVLKTDSWNSSDASLEGLVCAKKFCTGVAMALRPR